MADYGTIGVFQQLKLQPSFQPSKFSFGAKGVAELSRVSFSLGTQVGSLTLRKWKMEEILSLPVGKDGSPTNQARGL